MADIAIDARKYFDFGIGTYIQNLASALSQVQARHRFTLLADRGECARVENPAGWRVAPVSFKKYSLGELILFGYYVRKTGVDLLHIPHYTLPIGLRGRSVVTVHDLIHLKFPQYFSSLQRAYAWTVLSHVARHAGAIITGTEHARKDLIETLGVAEERVHAIYHGIRPGFRRITDQRRIGDFRERFSLRNPYILYVGNIKPHKDIPTLLKAFGNLRRSMKHVDLVFAGEYVFRNAHLETLARTLAIAEQIKDLGHLSTDDLVCAYNAADVLVLPSLYEGFGFTAVEAMACETPVVAADAASLPEVIADAGLMFKAHDLKDLEDALRRVLTETQTKNELVEKGRQNIQRFSWDRAARQTLRVYESVLGGI